MLVFLGIIILLGLFFVYSVNGNRGNPGLTELRSWFYAHRGLHGDGVPENSLDAFRLAKEAGYGIELDVHLLKDGNLAVIHDSSLLRTAGVDVQVESLTTQELGRYRLQNTMERVPLFQQVLDLYNGAAPLIVELKSVDHNYEALCQAACEMLDAYKGSYCLESFDPRCIHWLKKNRPELIRGQLVDNFLKGNSELPLPLRFAIRHQVFNFLTRPDFIAYRFEERQTISNRIARELWGIQGVTWTLKTQEDFDTALTEGWIPIFESIRP